MHVQPIERLSRATSRVRCHVVRRNSLLIKFDRVYIAFSSAFILFTEPLTGEYVCVSRGWPCSYICTCCHAVIEAADQTFHLTQSQCPAHEPPSSNADPRTPGAGIMEADNRQAMTVFTVQPSFHHRHSTNRAS